MEPGVTIPTLPTYMFEPNLRGLLSFASLWLLPLLAGLLSKQSWRPSTKGMILFGLALVKTFIEAIIAGSGDPSFDVWATLYTTLLNWIIAVGLYWGVIRGSRPQEIASNSGVVD